MSTTDKSVKFFPKHLEDQPSDTDKFGGGEKIAQAIKEIIDNTPCDNDLYRRKPIGLLGGWGSGKSSVIKNLSRLYTPEKAQAGKAKKSPELKTYIFEFDAWVYENDPIRRSFLEAFVKFLARETTPNGDVITTEEEWQDDLDRVKGQSEDHITTSTPVLTESGKTLGISLMLFPIGLAMLANRIDAAWYYYLLLAFLGIPFWIGYWANKFHTDKENVLSLFFNKTTDKVVNHIVKTPDPTAIEFQDIFSKILNKCLSNENTRLIVVIDNLDRLPEDKALALWATMRSFFVDREGDSAAFDNLWLIVPLDPVSLKVLFDGENIDQPSVDAKIKSYLEKTFEITFRVAPPVLSDWEKFLIEKGQEAFYDPSIASKNDWKTVARLYEVFLQSDETVNSRETVTPRKIITLINSISSLYRLWPFPIEILALYCIFRDKIEKDIYSITQETYLPRTAINIVNDPKWQEYIAALYFNTEPQKAVQILIEDKLIAALKNGDVENAEKQMAVPGADSIAEKLVETHSQIWSKSEPHHLFQMAYVLGELEKNGAFISDRCWRYIAQSTKTIQSWTDITEKSSLGVEKLLERLQAAAAHRAGLNTIKSLQYFTEPAILSKDEISHTWFNSFMSAESYIERNDVSDKQIARLAFPDDLAFRINLLFSASTKTPVRALERFLSSGPELEQPAFEQQISSEIGQKISSAEPDKSALDVINNILRVSDGWDFQPIVNAFDAGLRSGHSPEISLEALHQLYLKTNEDQKGHVNNVYVSLCRQGVILDRFHSVYNDEQKDIKNAARCVVGALKFNPTGDIDSHHGQSGAAKATYDAVLVTPNNHSELVEEISQQIMSLFKIEELIALHRDHVSTRPLITVVLNKIMNADAKKITFEASEVLANYETYSLAFGETGIPKLILLLAENKNFLEVLKKQEFTGSPSELHQILAKDTGPTGKAYKTYASKELNALAKEAWVESITNQDEKLRITGVLQTAGVKLDFGSDFRSAIEDLTYNLHDGTFATEQNWSALASCMSSANEKTFYKNVRDYLISKRLSDGFYRVVTLLGDSLFEYGEFDAKGKADEVMRHLFAPMLSTKEGLEFLTERSSAITSVFKNASPETKDTFSQDVAKNISDHFGDEQATNFFNLATAMNLKEAISTHQKLEKEKLKQEREAQQDKEKKA